MNTDTPHTHTTSMKLSLMMANKFEEIQMTYNPKLESFKDLMPPLRPWNNGPLPLNETPQHVKVVKEEIYDEYGKKVYWRRKMKKEEVKEDDEYLRYDVTPPVYVLLCSEFCYRFCIRPIRIWIDKLIN